MLENIALAILLGIGGVIAFAIFFIHDIPYKIAKKRDHPQQDAIYAACWISLFTLHLLWPLLFLWAVSKPPVVTTQVANAAEEIERLRRENEELRARLKDRPAA